MECTEVIRDLPKTRGVSQGPLKPCVVTANQELALLKTVDELTGNMRADAVGFDVESMSVEAGKPLERSGSLAKTSKSRSPRRRRAKATRRRVPRRAAIARENGKGLGNTHSGTHEKAVPWDNLTSDPMLGGTGGGVLEQMLSNEVDG